MHLQLVLPFEKLILYMIKSASSWNQHSSPLIYINIDSYVCEYNKICTTQVLHNCWEYFKKLCENYCCGAVKSRNDLIKPHWPYDGLSSNLISCQCLHAFKRWAWNSTQPPSMINMPLKGAKNVFYGLIGPKNLRRPRNRLLSCFLILPILSCQFL